MFVLDILMVTWIHLSSAGWFLYLLFKSDWVTQQVISVHWILWNQVFWHSVLLLLQFVFLEPLETGGEKVISTVASALWAQSWFINTILWYPGFVSLPWVHKDARWCEGMTEYPMKRCCEQGGHFPWLTSWWCTYSFVCANSHFYKHGKVDCIICGSVGLWFCFLPELIFMILSSCVSCVRCH